MFCICKKLTPKKMFSCLFLLVANFEMHNLADSASNGKLN